MIGRSRLLQVFAKFWHDCLVAESASAQVFRVPIERNSSPVATFPGSSDVFISRRDGDYLVLDNKTQSFIDTVLSSGKTLFYGYPLVISDDNTQLMPIFIRQLQITKVQGTYRLTANKEPVVNPQALKALGISPKDLQEIQRKITESLRKGTVHDALRHVSRKKLDVKNLSVDDSHPVRNQAVLFAHDSMDFNAHLLHDLDQLSQKTGLSKTSLGYLSGQAKAHKSQHFPILPFAFDEYHIQAIVEAQQKDRLLITGPPGTGKSQCIANLLVSLTAQGKSVLFVSHTAESIRVVQKRITTDFPGMILQTGNKHVRRKLQDTLEDLYARPLQQQAKSKVSYRTLKRSWHTIQRESAYVARTHRLQRKILQSPSPYTVARLRHRKGVHENLEILAALMREHRVMSQDYVATHYLNTLKQEGALRTLQQFIRVGEPSNTALAKQAIVVAPLWACTLKSLAATFPLEANLFDYIVLDEASQVDLAAAAPALYRARSVVVVGDPNQLSHITSLTEDREFEIATNYKLTNKACYPDLVSYRETSLFTSLKKAKSSEVLLRNHYRSHPDIARLFSSIFYNNSLLPRSSRAIPPGLEVGVRWRDVQGVSKRGVHRSRSNVAEVDTIVGLLDELLPIARSQGLKIGITTPYTEQRVHIDRAVSKAYPRDIGKTISILTVHSFQGSEADIILFSTVISGKGTGGSDTWYVRNSQVLNVAISRARHLLVIVGDQAHALKSASKLQAIASYCDTPTKDRTPHIAQDIVTQQLYDIAKEVIDLTKLRIQKQDKQHGIAITIRGSRLRVALEVDGNSYESLQSIPINTNSERDTLLKKDQWDIVYIRIDDILYRPEKVAEIVRTICRA